VYAAHGEYEGGSTGFVYVYHADVVVGEDVGGVGGIGGCFQLVVVVVVVFGGWESSSFGLFLF